MTYKLNNVQLDPQPTTGRWLERELIGLTGDGRPVYEPTRQFEMEFNLLSATGYSVLQDNWLTIDVTGTLVIDLPKYGSATYEFRSYSGCFIHEPNSGPYFTEHRFDTRLLVTNIITEK
jgi:hypothetical protein